MTIFLSFILSLSLWSSTFNRLDKLAKEELTIPSVGILMFMSQGCVHCKAQLKDFEECLDKKIPVLLFLEGRDEAALRKEVRRHKFKYPVYWTTEEFKKTYEVGQATPTMILLFSQGQKKIEGRLQCEKLKPILDRLF